MKQRRTFEEKKGKQKLYSERHKKRMKEQNVYHPELLRTPRKPI